MKAASIHELKKELQALPPAKMLEYCMRLIKYKKENKELLTYLLFDADDEPTFVFNVKHEMDEQFNELNTSSLYLAKKTIRKVLRTTKKYIRYSGDKQTEVELLIYFCIKLKSADINLNKSTAMFNLYTQQLIHIDKALTKLHEDLQYDYHEEIETLKKPQ